MITGKSSMRSSKHLDADLQLPPLHSPLNGSRARMCERWAHLQLSSFATLGDVRMLGMETNDTCIHAGKWRDESFKPGDSEGALAPASEASLLEYEYMYYEYFCTSKLVYDQCSTISSYLSQLIRVPSLAQCSPRTRSNRHLRTTSWSARRTGRARAPSRVRRTCRRRAPQRKRSTGAASSAGIVCAL